VTVTRTAFDLGDRLIAYDDDMRAVAMPQRLNAFDATAAASIMGVVAFTDDDCVHADHWECHPAGDEVLVVLEGCLTATVDRTGAIGEDTIGPGQAFIVPRACWHRLKVVQPGRLLFFTPVAGTRLRPHVAS
jgi:mannose-6-phosphate isomerase-like protein (cupin superfamily)